uniref:DUF4283 domain-containing protein n=1 Tax=Solanum tuberosum TaxID=4113 RepID=M1BVX7_SOLTU
MAILKSLVILTIKFLAKEIELSLSIANLMRNMISLLPVLTRRSTSLNLPRILLSKPMLRDLGITNPYIIDNSVKLTTPEVTTKQGLPAVLFVKEEVLGPLAEVCKYTLIGKFTHTMPKMELIRKSFILQTQLSGGVKNAHYNARHIYIDLDNELDYNTVWTKQRMSIVGQLM